MVASKCVCRVKRMGLCHNYDTLLAELSEAQPCCVSGRVKAATKLATTCIPTTPALGRGLLEILDHRARTRGAKFIFRDDNRQYF